MQDENDLWIASRRYVLGEISIEELKAVEEPFNDAFDNALYVTAKREMCRRIFLFWRRKA